ncbi:MAG TPA: NADH-quinone oxidoreductase subunit C [Verrucomicrobiae bacterium]|nr:NADH-quinone oxidoreductase subunit C [Verrucomicrobiae bacterium]
MKPIELSEQITQRWKGRARVLRDAKHPWCDVECFPDILRELARWLFAELSYRFAGLIVEEGENEWELRYGFYGRRDEGFVQLLVRRPLPERTFPSISEHVHAADWHEREAEDLFGLSFEGHPRLGDFILHDDAWQEGVEPMRHKFDGNKPVTQRAPKADWRPRRIVEAPGAFAMPIGPVFGALTESVHFQLETVGEDVIRTIPRLFYKYRGIEKIAEGRSVEDALLLAERFCGTSAFAHGFAFCQAVESICGVEVPARARTLRVFVAELERYRHHVTAIEGICESTALAVAASQTAILQEELLRLSCVLTGHRYLFGLLVPGGLTRDLQDGVCRETLATAQNILRRLQQIDKMLRFSSSFLDRLEEVGIVGADEARNHGLVGPVARASGLVRDLRKILPYSAYTELAFDVPTEREGDGYARLRILFAEAVQSVRIMEQAFAALREGPVSVPCPPKSGAALGWVEAARGAAFQWVRIGDDGLVGRYRIMPPSFANWHGFHLAAENFAFQDFPIILATFDLSVAENDR